MGPGQGSQLKMTDSGAGTERVSSAATSAGLGSQTAWVTVVPQCPHLPNGSAYYRQSEDESFNTSEHRVTRDRGAPDLQGCGIDRAGEVK